VSRPAKHALQNKQAIARNFLKLGMSLGDIAHATGLSQADLLQLQSEGQPRH
jgi:hypothetical protein